MYPTNPYSRTPRITQADVYGPRFGHTTAQASALEGPTMARARDTAAGGGMPVDLAVARSFLTTPAGVLLILAGALIVLSLSD